MRKRDIILVAFNSLLLLLSFFLVGEFHVFYVGAVVYFANGYFLAKHMDRWKIFILSLILFFVIVFNYFMYPGVMKGNQTFPNPMGFVYYGIVFYISFKAGSLITFFIKNNKVKQLVFYSILLLFIGISSNFLGHGIALIATGVTYFIGSLIVLRKNEIKFTELLLWFVISYTVVHFLGSLGEGGNFQIIYPKILFVAVSISLAYFMKNAFQKSKYILVFLIILVEICIAAIGYTAELNWVEYLTSETFEMPINNEVSLSFKNIQDSLISTKQMKGKIVVLDFWSTTCSVCFKKFPEFEKFYQKYKGNDKVLIYAVNIPTQLSDSISEIKRIIAKQNYNFPFLIAQESYDFYKKDIIKSGFPQLTIIDKSGKIIYTGSFNNNPLILVNNLERMMDTLQ